MTNTQIITLIRQKITDPLLRQNSAARVREAVELLATQLFNAAEDELPQTAVTGLAATLGDKANLVGGKVPLIELPPLGGEFWGVLQKSAADPQTVQAAITAAVTALVNGAPGALDALNELAAALGNDPNFSTTVLNAIAAIPARLGTGLFSGGVGGENIINSGAHSGNVGGSQVINSGAKSGSAGGFINNNSGIESGSVGGGGNTNSGPDCASVGGAQNRNVGDCCVSLGGVRNYNEGQYSSSIGGQDNVNRGPYSTVINCLNTQIPATAKYVTCVGCENFIVPANATGKIYAYNLQVSVEGAERYDLATFPGVRVNTVFFEERRIMSNPVLGSFVTSFSGQILTGTPLSAAAPVRTGTPAAIVTALNADIAALTVAQAALYCARFATVPTASTEESHIFITM